MREGVLACAARLLAPLQSASSSAAGAGDSSAGGKKLRAREVPAICPRALLGKTCTEFWRPSCMRSLDRTGACRAWRQSDRRMFTGDNSGTGSFVLFIKPGCANQAASRDRHDRPRDQDCYITAAIRCAPPGNKPLSQELARCRGYLLNEIDLLRNVRVVVGLGRVGFETGAGIVPGSRKNHLRQTAQVRSRHIRCVWETSPSLLPFTRASRTPSRADSPSRCSMGCLRK